MKVFISSVYADPLLPGEERHLAVRRALYQKGSARGHDMWVAEYSNMELTSHTPWRQIVDTCTAGVRQCDLFIALLFRRWGSAIEVDQEGPSATSFFEIELLHASVRQVPSFFIQAEGFDPEPGLRRLLDIIRRVSSDGHWLTRADGEIEDTALDIIDALAASRSSASPFLGFNDALSDAVSFADVSREIVSDRLSLVGRFPTMGGRSGFSLSRAQALLADARNTPSKAMEDYADKLSRLWMALRELSKLAPDELDDSGWAAWFELAAQWSGPSAWMGLHGPLKLGALAALQTRMDVARRRVQPGPPPYGAFASEAYSIGKVSHTRKWQARRFLAARQLATRQAALSDADPSGAWLIRASATMQLARLGRPWMALVAQSDYRAALAHRLRHAATPSAVGEAQVELGFALFSVGRLLPWQRGEGLGLMREGVASLESDGADQRAGFIHRGREKLAIALDASGLKDEADHVRSRGREDASS